MNPFSFQLSFGLVCFIVAIVTLTAQPLRFLLACISHCQSVRGGLFCFVFPLENKITVFLSCFISCGLNIISVYFNYVIFWGLVCFTTTLRDTLKNFLICFIRHGFESVWHCLCIFSVQKVKDWLSVDFERKCSSRKWMETQKQPRIV